MAGRRKSNAVIIAAIVLAALCLRVLASVQLARINGGMNPVYLPSPLTDMATYWELSGRILSGDFATEYFYYQPFYYAVWLTGLRALGDSINMVVAAQILLGTLTVLLAMQVGRSLGGRRCGWIAGALTAVDGALLLYTPYLMIVNLQAFWLIAITLVGVRLARGRGAWWLPCLFGVLIGCAILTRGNGWYLVPGALLLIFCAAKGLAAVRSAALMLCCILLVQLPFIVHNSRLAGELKGASTASSQVLALGNTPEAPAGGREFFTNAGPMEYPPAYEMWIAADAETPVITRILQWAQSEPLAFGEHQFRKLLLFWDWREIPNNVAFADGAGIAPALFWTTGIILVLGLAGLLSYLCRAFARRRLALLWLCYVVLGYWAATAAFYNLSRFRAPILPLLAVFAGLFLVGIAAGFKRRGIVGIWRSAAIALLAVFVVYSGFDTYRSFDPAIMRAVRPHGVRVDNMYLDSGPLTYGVWEDKPLLRGDVYTKEFSAPDVAGEVEVTFYSAKPGIVRLLVDGTERGVNATRGVFTERFPISGNKVVIEVVEPSGASLVFDLGRDYGRTTKNGTPMNAELVARLFQ